MQVIQTHYNGYHFRSRTEARWAVFFDTAGIKYEYEKEGFDIDGEWYLPDFWLPDLERWFEVKGESPSQAYLSMLGELRKQSGYDVLLAVGAPDMTGNIFIPNSLNDGHAFFLAEDRCAPNIFWLSSDDACGALSHGASDRWPLVTPVMEAAYLAARQARFEHRG